MPLCNDGTQVVPGHGAMGDRRTLVIQHDYWDKLREAVAKAKDKDKLPREEAIKLKPAGFDGYGGAERLPIALGVVYDELSRGG